MSWTTNDKGAIAELAIATAAVRRGVFVLRPMSEGLRYDLLFDLDPELVRVQCKWGALKEDVITVRTGTCRHTPSGYLRTTYSAAEIDALAVYCDALDRCYLLPIAAVEGQSYVHLRLAPARNGQRALVRMADDYDLDKMLAALGL